MFSILTRCLVGLLVFLVISCREVEQKYNYDIQLNSEWKFRKAGDVTWLPTHVPGNVISDLLRNKKIDSSFFPTNANKILWIAKADWEYQTVFAVDPDILSYNVVQLCFKGLDTYADVYLNDSLLLKADNISQSWTVDCKSILKETDNHLRIYFHSSTEKQKRVSTFLLKNKENNPANIIAHKAFFYDRCCLVNPLSHRGIFRTIHLQAWSMAKIDDLYLHPKQITKKFAKYIAEFSIYSTINQNVNVELLINNKPVQPQAIIPLKKGQNQEHLIFTIENPKLWWTNGLGNQHLYNITLRVKKEQSVIHERHQRLGIRTIELDQQPDSFRNNLYFRINGVPVFIKGIDYCPCNLLSAHNKSEIYKRVIGDARLANINMIRVLNGGIYEDDLFYDLCDEQGILIWQDFMLNSTILSPDTSYLKNVRQSAIENVKRLRNHASLSLWCGHNDNLEMDRIKSYSKNITFQLINNSQKLFYRLFPSVVKEYDYQTAYWVSTGGKSNEINERNILPMTQDTIKNRRYFITGYGMPSLPSLRTVKTFVLPKDMQFGLVPMNVNRQNILPIRRAANTDNLILDNIFKNYKLPKDFESFIYLSQIVQADALKDVIEGYRRNMPSCTGVLCGQLNDCQPSISCSTIDYFGRWKLAHYTIKQAFTHILVIPVRENNFVNIYAASDALKDMEAILLAKLIDFRGKVLYVKQIPVELKANNSKLLLSVKESEILKKAVKSECCLIVQLNQPNITLSQNILYFTESKNLTLSRTKIDIDVNETVKGYNLILKSGLLMKNVYLETDVKDSYFSDNNFDLLPEKRMKISVHYLGTKKELLKDLKIRSLGDIE